MRLREYLSEVFGSLLIILREKRSDHLGWFANLQSVAKTFSIHWHSLRVLTDEALSNRFPAYVGLLQECTAYTYICILIRLVLAKMILRRKCCMIYDRTTWSCNSLPGASVSSLAPKKYPSSSASVSGTTASSEPTSPLPSRSARLRKFVSSPNKKTNAYWERKREILKDLKRLSLCN